jgi:hypothetical protein
MEWNGPSIPSQRAVPGRPDLSPAGLMPSGRGLARHRIKTGHAVSCRPTGPETKLEHGPVAIKRVVLGRPEVQINFHIFIFLINFVFLIKNLFNIIKFELKIYDSTLNNIIKNSLYHFLLCRVGLIGSTIGPSRARPNVSCRAWHRGPEVRLGHGSVQASGRHNPLSFVSGCAHAGPITSFFGPAHLAWPGWSGIGPSLFGWAVRVGKVVNDILV